MAEAKQRIDRVFRPYHDQLLGLLNENIELFGKAILFDCHSMPSKAVSEISFKSGTRPEIVLGNLHGASCAREISEEARRIFTEAGFCVGMNTPYAGAYVAEKYGSPFRKCHVLQIEVDRAIYMDENNIRPHANFRSVQQAIRHAVRKLAGIGSQEMRLAAE